MPYPFDDLDVLTNDDPANTNGTGAEHVGYHNEERAALADVKNALGLGPAGTATDVGARFDNAEAAWTPDLQGMLAWTSDPAGWAVNAQTLTLGTLYLCEVYLPLGTVTGVNFRALTGATLTACYVGLYDTSAVRLGLSANLSSVINALGSNTHIDADLAAPVAVAAPGLYRLAIFGAGSVAMQVGRTGSGTSSNARRSSTTARFATADTSISALPTTHGTMSLSTAALGMGAY